MRNGLYLQTSVSVWLPLWLSWNPPAMWRTWIGKITWRREANGYLLQYSALENSMDYMLHGVAKSRTGQSDFNFPLHLTLKECSRPQSALLWMPQVFFLLLNFSSRFQQSFRSRKHMQVGKYGILLLNHQPDVPFRSVSI